MDRLRCALLLVLVSAVAAATSLDARESFDQRQWMRQLSAAWGGDSPPLAKAFHALRASNVSAHATRINDQCLQDVKYLLSLPGLWAYQMLDSGVKIPEGLLQFSLTHLGNWDECVAVGDEPSLAGRFRGKMCFINYQPVLDVRSNEPGVPRDATQESNLLAAMLIKLATCVPSSCNADDMQTLFTNLETTSDAQGVRSVGLGVTVGESDCTERDRPAFDSSDWVGVGLLSALGAVVALSTAYDVLTPPSRTKPLPAAFSVVSNGRKLFALASPGGDQTLSCLHGIRFLSMCWVVMGHSYVISTYVPSINPGFMSQFLEDWYRIGVANATLSVDTFLVLGGLLVGYLFFKQEPSKRRLNIPMYYLHRYIRLTPALAMVVLLNATLATRMGWGPLWTSLVHDIRENCQKNWWTTLLYVGNYVNPTHQCVDQSWYLMVDMQLHWLSPLVLLPLARWPRVGAALLSCLSVAGIVAVFVVTYVKHIFPNMLGVSDPQAGQDFLKYYYVTTHTRFVPYLEGLAIGYVLANQRAVGQKLPTLKCSLKILAWFLAASLLLVPLMTGIEFIQQPLPSRGWMATYNALYRPAWALGVGAVVYLCATGNGRPVNQFLSWWGFQFLGRLSYSVYLVHATLQVTKAGTLKTSAHNADTTILAQFAGDLTLSLLLGAALSLLCESPFIALEKELFRKVRRETPNAEAAAGTASVNSATTSIKDPTAEV